MGEFGKPEDIFSIYKIHTHTINEQLQNNIKINAL